VSVTHRRPPADGVADVWFRDGPASMDRVERWIAVLDDEERARAEEFRTPELRARHVGAHALVRTALSAYGPVPPVAWRYSYGPSGQPTLVGARADLRFSLSHSGRHAAVAVTVGRAVGLDLEEVELDRDELAIAERFFTVEEQEALRACELDARAERFTTLWTVKEAVLKARGLGVGSGLATVAVTLDERGAPRAVTAPGGPWSVCAWSPERGLRAAVAVQGESLPRLRVFRAVPLDSASPAPELGPG